MNNNPDPNQTDQNVFSVSSSSDTPVSTVPPVLPPIQPEPLETVPTTPSSEPIADMGSAAPIANTFDINPSPVKKFGSGKIVATILGILLLVGGLGTGVYLTQQDQNIGEKAANISCGGGCPDEDCHCDTVECLTQSCKRGLHDQCVGAGLSWCINSTGKGMTCCDDNSLVCGPGGKGCVPGTNKPPKDTPPPDVTASCQDVKAYKADWTVINSNQLKNLKVGDSVNLCVSGTTTQGKFDKARFQINNGAKQETETKRPGSDDFCKNYTVPAGITTFNIEAEIHHPTLGWK